MRPDSQSAWRHRIIWSLVGFAAAFGVGLAYAWALRQTGDWNDGIPWERALLERVEPRPAAHPVLDTVMLWLPWLGTNLTLMPALLAVEWWLIFRRRRFDLAANLFTVQVGSLLLTAFVKDVFGRPRPQLWAPRGEYWWSSYPSGHAIIGVSVFFTIAAMLHHERGWRWPYAVALGLLLLNNYSRLYLGVHWPTDVLGGLLIGVTWFVTTRYAYRSAPAGEAASAA